MMTYRLANTERDRLLERGMARVYQFVTKNHLPLISIHSYDGRPSTQISTCAYYRDDQIHIWPEACAAVGRAGRQWSYPGYVVDRTPYGVVAHELGHHVDRAHGPRGGTLSHAWYALTHHGLVREEAITGYAPNVNEWFAELFRLYVTNPRLLKLLRPHVCALMMKQWQPVETRPWETVLKDAPRQIAAARNKIARVQRRATSQVTLWIEDEWPAHAPHEPRG